ncbi:hypothetical protein [Flavobacterium sp.]
MAWDLLSMVIPAVRSNLFSIALGFNPKQLKKGFPLPSGLKIYHFNIN